MISCYQFGLNTCDMAATLRLYAEAFGFRNAGSEAVWGEPIGIQGLPPEGRAILWWLVGTQPFFQLEIFQHTMPEQRRLPEDWRPSDHGWVRFGLSVVDLDLAIARIQSYGLRIVGQDVGGDGRRRMVFFDHFVGAMVEVREKPGSDGPSVIYGAASVSDLEGAERYYGDVLGFELGPLEELHEPGDEALWGLEGAKRKGFVVRSGDVSLEILRYDQPVGRPIRSDRRASDQGFYNVAFGSHVRDEIEDVFGRIRASEVRSFRTLSTDEVFCAYVNDPERETEFGYIDRKLMKELGFEPALPFFG